MPKIKCICIVDDDKVHTYILSKLIQKFELSEQILSYPNGGKAMEAFREMSSNNEPFPNVILLDINMPEMDGWEFIDAFKELKKDHLYRSMIYISSSSISLEDKEKAASYPEVLNYLTKPIEPATLINLIKTDWDKK
jgi:CheY-like chemotaxis protein